MRSSVVVRSTGAACSSSRPASSRIYAETNGHRRPAADRHVGPRDLPGATPALLQTSLEDDDNAIQCLRHVLKTGRDAQLPCGEYHVIAKTYIADDDLASVVPDAKLYGLL